MTTKQRAHLRSLANNIEPILHIGKDGINDNLIKQAWDALEARELVKASLLRASPFDSAREACDALCAAVHAEPVQVIGNKFVMYRKSRKPKIIIGERSLTENTEARRRE